MEGSLLQALAIGIPSRFLDCFQTVGNSCPLVVPVAAHVIADNVPAAANVPVHTNVLGTSNVPASTSGPPTWYRTSYLMTWVPQDYSGCSTR